MIIRHEPQFGRPEIVILKDEVSCAESAFSAHLQPHISRSRRDIIMAEHRRIGLHAETRPRTCDRVDTEHAERVRNSALKITPCITAEDLKTLALCIPGSPT